MGYINYSPWQDAAQYGEGLGRTLGQAMLSMPQQRAELALQNAQFDQQRQQEGLRMALAQKAQDANHQLGLSELNLHQQEMLHNQQQHEADLAVQRMKAENEAKGTWKITETPSGVPILLNSLTGETKQVTFDGDKSGGLGATDVNKLFAKQITPTAQMDNDVKLAQMFPMMRDSSMTNYPALMNSYSNATVQALGRLTHQAPPAPPTGLGASGIPWANPQQVQNPGAFAPAVGNQTTNALPSQVGAGLPIGSPSIQGLGAIPTNAPMTNSPIRIRRWNNVTGQLE